MSSEMEMEASSASYMYGNPSSDLLHIDDLFDFSNPDIFFDSSSDASSSHHHHPPPDCSAGIRPLAGNPDTNPFRSSFSDDLCVPSDDVAELEWLSQFVEDSFSDVPFPGDGSYIAGNVISRPDASVPGRARSKRSRAAAVNNSWISLPSTAEPDVQPPAGFPEAGKGKGGARRRELVIGDGGIRKCTHCATEKTPQWRTGPLGPKSLCNACGVRYKSGRLVPEYRPAASPTFVLTQHSNSHRKVMELRRQKEMVVRQESFHDFKVC
ncbi:GATA transcription factor 4-like [Magnolia sinica]|uniref:GATA transcription factor 4-like n=1 Tax=Magnolia sinica TaxID=86752 RepID=UPI002658082B|nr:GATA transcription factor 4-like [Magnolia sinica]XP_058086421.1 GATA transcription factor 4-like [Magnolia sinica]